MTREEVKKHNDWIASLPRWKGSPMYPLIVSQHVAETMIESGLWEENKHLVAISEYLPTNIDAVKLPNKNA